MGGRLQSAAVNIALVTETFPPEINGVAMTLHRLVGGLAARGHEVEVFRPHPADGRRSPEPEPWREHRLPGMPIPGYRTMRLGLPLAGRLRARWKIRRPDVVHVATEGPLGWAALRAARAEGLPVSSSFHTNFHQYSQHYGVGWLTRPALAYLRWFHNRTRLTLSPTRDLNEHLTRDGFRNVRLFSRGVDTHLFSPTRRDHGLRQSWGAGPGDLLVLHVSRLAAEKNYALLQRSWEAIRHDRPRTVFVLASDGPMRAKLARAMPWTRFTGFLAPVDLARHYASSDLFLYPSLTETFGNVLTEAMASGLAVLAYDYAAARRYVRTGENGITLPLGSPPDQFVQAARQLAHDPENGRRLGAAARVTAECIPWDAVVDAFARDLQSLLAPVEGASLDDRR